MSGKIRILDSIVRIVSDYCPIGYPSVASPRKHWKNFKTYNRRRKIVNKRRKQTVEQEKEGKLTVNFKEEKDHAEEEEMEETQVIVVEK